MAIDHYSLAGAMCNSLWINARGMGWRPEVHGFEKMGDRLRITKTQGFESRQPFTCHLRSCKGGNYMALKSTSSMVDFEDMEPVDVDSLFTSPPGTSSAIQLFELVFMPLASD